MYLFLHVRDSVSKVRCDNRTYRNNNRILQQLWGVRAILKIGGGGGGVG